ncbi:MAG: SRPBCC family protein [Chloroflexota bacterium]|nr:SRPBCC family protein [Chloroflexota bacterium]
MARVTKRITIRRPIEDVFAILTDVEKTGLWFPGNVKEHWTSPPPYGVGSTRRASVTMFGRRSENDAVATEYDPPHRAAMRGTTPNAPFDATLIFAPVADGTQVEVTTAFHLGGWTRIFGPGVDRLRLGVVARAPDPQADDGVRRPLERAGHVPLSCSR